jgi:hypothetical protein
MARPLSPGWSLPLVDREVGFDLSTGLEYGPLLTNNVIILMGASALIPSNGFRQLYNRVRDDRSVLGTASDEVTLTY